MFDLLVIDQGVSVENVTTATTCLIAYADRSHDRLFTAGHCGATGDRFSFEGQEIGVFSTGFAGLPGAGDWGLIHLNERAAAGQNIVTGDRVAGDADLSPGTRVCRLAGDQAVACGPLEEQAAPGLLLASPHLRGFPGDSGGPVWSVDGFVGVYTGHWRDGTVAVVRIPADHLPAGAVSPAGSSSLLSS